MKGFEATGDGGLLYNRLSGQHTLSPFLCQGTPRGISLLRCASVFLQTCFIHLSQTVSCNGAGLIHSDLVTSALLGAQIHWLQKRCRIWNVLLSKPSNQAQGIYQFIIILCFKDHHYYCRNLCVFYHISNMTYVSPLQLRRQQFGEGVRKQSVLNGFFILLSLPFTSMQSG